MTLSLGWLWNAFKTFRASNCNWPWRRYFPSLCRSFFVYEVGLLILAILPPKNLVKIQGNIWKHLWRTRVSYCNNFRVSGIPSFPALVSWQMLGGKMRICCISLSLSFSFNLLVLIFRWIGLQSCFMGDECGSLWGSIFYHLAHNITRLPTEPLGYWKVFFPYLSLLPFIPNWPRILKFSKIIFLKCKHLEWPQIAQTNKWMKPTVSNNDIPVDSGYM